MRIVFVILSCHAVALAQGGPARVEVAEVVSREVAAGRSFVGAVEPSRMSTVGSEVEGHVVAFLVREGDRVEKGQPLAKLRTRLLEIRLDAARAELETRRQELAELENGARPEEIEEARARARQAEADRDLRVWKLASARRLFLANSISEDELKEAELAARAAEERNKEQAASLRLVEAGPRQERIAQARAKLEAQQAAVAELEDDLAQHTIAAPFAGYVVAEHTEVGQWLAKGNAVVEIAALDEVDVTVPVLEDYVGGLRPGAPVAVTIDALGTRLFTGELHAIVPRADPRSRTFPVKIRLANERRGAGVVLKAGMFARVRLAVGDKRPALLVPKDAIVLGGPRGPMVFVVRNGKATPAIVEFGIAVDGAMQVLGPLQAGERVVVRGNERLRPGQDVVVVGDER